MASASRSTEGSYGSLNALLPLLEHLEQQGADLSAILERVGIPRAVQDDPKLRLPKGRFEALWTAAIEATGDPAIALRVSTLVKPSTLGIIGYLAAASESSRNAFELVRNLVPLFWDDLECDLVTEGEVAFIRIKADEGQRPSRFLAEYAIGLAVTMHRALGPARSDPIEARFSHAAPAYSDEYERILQLPVCFEAGEDGVVFPMSIMDVANPSADAALRQLLERYAADQLSRVTSGARLSQRVRSAILSMLPLDNTTADTLAERFSMSSRTLRRRLQSEGTSYQEVLDDVRCELARRLLREGRGIEQVAFELGFSDPSAFTKAFKRWTDVTPAEFVRSAPRS